MDVSSIAAGILMICNHPPLTLAELTVEMVRRWPVLTDLTSDEDIAAEVGVLLDDGRLNLDARGRYSTNRPV